MLFFKLKTLNSGYNAPYLSSPFPEGGNLVHGRIPNFPQQKRFIQHNFPVAIPKKPGKCPGRKNIVDDINFFGLMNALISSSFAMFVYTIIVNSMASSNIDTVSHFLHNVIFWIPRTIISLFHLDEDYVWLMGRSLNSLSFEYGIFEFMQNLVGNTDVLASVARQSVGVIPIMLSVIGTFPDFLDAIVKLLYRMGNKGRLVYLIENYGCEVPGFFRWYGKSFYQLVNDLLVNLMNSKGQNQKNLG